jgi:hypothetical protein
VKTGELIEWLERVYLEFTAAAMRSEGRLVGVVGGLLAKEEFEREFRKMLWVETFDASVDIIADATELFVLKLDLPDEDEKPVAPNEPDLEILKYWTCLACLQLISLQTTSCPYCHPVLQDAQRVTGTPGGK